MKYTQKLLFTLLMAFTLTLTFAQSGDIHTRDGATRTGDGKSVVAVSDNQLPVSSSIAQDTGIDYANPKTFWDQGAIGALFAGITALLAYLGGFLPGLRSIKPGIIRSGIVVFVAVCVLGTFKAGGLSEDLVQNLVNAFLPNFAYSGIIWEAVKIVLRLLKVQIPSPIPSNG